MSIEINYHILVILLTIIYQVKSIHLPEFQQVFERVMLPPSVTNNHDPCRFFKIKNDSIYRMGESNIISKWDVYNTSSYYEQALYYSLTGSVNITNLGLSLSSD
jgi:hypothetical protein